ncbi:MAG: cytochrome c-type biogenesis protein CcmH [Woeseiaceae bacterium]|jgi:cytochrome c-type biogenesis protein CcmH
MLLWIIFGVMLFVAALVVAIPLYRAEKRLTSGTALSVLVVVALSATVYSYVGSPNVNPLQDAAPDIDAMVSSLAARLVDNPDDLAGWKMLGRSYQQLKDFSGAEAAYEQAVRLESGENAQTLADLGEAVLLGDGRTINGRAGQLFEGALAIEPNNPKALFYSGLAAIERGDPELAVTRWEALLATSPPPNIEGILRQRIAELRGTESEPAQQQAGPAVVANIILGENAMAANLADTTVFIIARDPNQPSPPIAAVRRRLSELPTQVTLSDSDAMIPGRVPSAFSTLEIVARISVSGQPIAQPGDWFGQEIVDSSTAGPVQISIDQQVP